MDAIETLASLIESRTGYLVSGGQLSQLERWVAERLAKLGARNAASYVETLAAHPVHREWKELLAEVLVKESFLFRIGEQFEAFERVLLPRLVESIGRDRELRIWSAGCARGEEPATLALVLAENPRLPDHRWRIVATDVDERALEAAKLAEFGARAVARVPPRLLATRFDLRGDRWRLDRRLVERIDFQAFNFFETPYLSLGPLFDVIFLRNVLIYFQPEAQRKVLTRVVSRLSPGGYIFLGHSETLRQLADPTLDADLETLEIDGCYVHRRRSVSSPSLARDLPRARRPMPEPVGSDVESARSGLATPISQVSAKKDVEPVGEAPPELTGANLPEALCALSENRLEEARELVLRILEAEPGAARAHALAGLLHDVEGRACAAVEAYRKALYLEPGLFQIRLLRAHRFEHLGQWSRARGDYRQVLTDLANGEGRELGFSLAGVLDSKQRASRRAREALERL